MTRLASPCQESELIMLKTSGTIKANDIVRMIAAPRLAIVNN